MNKKNVIKAIYIILGIGALISAIYIAKYFYDTYDAKKQNNLLNEIQIEEPVEEEADMPVKTERMLQVEELQKINPDIVGWLEIPNTNVNYPVLQGTDNDYYLDHDYNKQKTSGGSIFLDKTYSWDPPSSNLLIYGHNMNNGTMFQNLLKYKDQKFYEENPNIRFTTNTEDATYEIIAVFQSKVFYKSQTNVFKFIKAENEEQYNYYVENVKKLSLYDTGKTAQYGDQLITLSTCAYHTENGRFVVVAKKANNRKPIKMYRI